VLWVGIRHIANVRNGSKADGRFGRKADILDNRTLTGQPRLMTEAASLVRDEITAAINHYLDVLHGRNGATLYDLAKALDGLVATYHRASGVEPDTIHASSAPRTDQSRIFEAASAAFPDLSWYATVDPQDGQEQQIGMSIAASDLAEIAADLMEVLWLFENGSHNDAVWSFRFGYQSHWGRHLHEIRFYLHELAAW
jgi:Domain of unknown function (DUF5063)